VGDLVGADEPLLVDLAAPPPPDPGEVAEWAADQRVFVSSVMGGMAAEREAVVAAIQAVGAVPVWFEEFGGRDDDPEEAYLGEVASSDIYVGILGARYGRPLKSGYSATHAEYNEAVRRGLRVSVWAADADVDGPQRDFLEAVRVFHTTGGYSSADDLGRRVEQRLQGVASEAIAPWVKVGNSVFRAARVATDSRQVVVTGRVRDGTVAASLEARRPGFGNRVSQIAITWPGGTTAARVSDVNIEIVTSRTQLVTVTADRVERQRSSSASMNMSYNGVSPEEQTQIALRVALLGEPNPFARDHMGFLVQMANPLSQLEGLALSEDAIGQVAQLLLTEELVGSGRADHIVSFQLGPKNRGSRRIALTWIPPRQYTNVIPEPLTLEGESFLSV
jgi:hypothetical protein